MFDLSSVDAAFVLKSLFTLTNGEEFILSKKLVDDTRLKRWGMPNRVSCGHFLRGECDKPAVFDGKCWAYKLHLISPNPKKYKYLISREKLASLPNNPSQLSLSTKDELLLAESNVRRLTKKLSLEGQIEDTTSQIAQLTCQIQDLNKHLESLRDQYQSLAPDCDKGSRLVSLLIPEPHLSGTSSVSHWDMLKDSLGGLEQWLLDRRVSEKPRPGPAILDLVPLSSGSSLTYKQVYHCLQRNARLPWLNDLLDTLWGQ